MITPRGLGRGSHGVFSRFPSEWHATAVCSSVTEGVLVAARQGEFDPPAEFRERIHPLYIRGEYDALSSTEVRERIARGEPWEHLVPEEIVDRVRAIYS